jgi:Ca2+-binding RTX toxin-like protein
VLFANDTLADLTVVGGAFDFAALTIVNGWNANSIIRIIGSSTADLLTGTANADELNGLDGDDSLVGLAGNDTINGGTGSDTLVGGDGNDVYYVDSSSDVVTELAGATSGFDIVISTANHTLSANVEQLVLQGAATVGTGNAGANILYGLYSGYSLTLNGMDGDDVIYGSTAGGNTLIGGSGVDTLLAYGGNNTMLGGLGSDIYYTYSASDIISEAGGDGIDTVYSNHDIVLGAGVEQVVLVVGATTATGGSDNNIFHTYATGGATAAYGNDGADVFYGGAYNDTFDGGNGVDYLFGYGGANTLIGGADTDIYYLESGLDIVIELVGGGFDTIYTKATTTTIGANVDQMILYGGAVNGIGDSMGNLLFGHTASNAVFLNGMAGDDYLLDSGFSNDTLIGGQGNDTIQLSTGGNDFVRYNVGGNMGNDTVLDFDADPTGGQDLIDLSGLGYTFGTNFSVTASGANTFINFTGGSLSGTTITLIGVNAANVTVDDFVL